MNVSLSAFAPENLVSRNGFGSPVPRQPAHLHTQAESDAYLRDSSRVPRRRPFIYFYRQTPSGQSRLYRVTQLRTDGVHRRESAGMKWGYGYPYICQYENSKFRPFAPRFRQVKHHEWIFGPNYGMVDLYLNKSKRPAISREC